MGSNWLATLLDQEMLETVSGITIAPHSASISDLPPKSGVEVARELRGRLLLRYVLPNQLGLFTHGSQADHWVTPTPLTKEDVVSWLSLPNPGIARTHVMLLDPSRINMIQGPKWIRYGSGIEYYLPEGFPEEAILQPWEIELR